jgi:hypothetical protein
VEDRSRRSSVTRLRGHPVSIISAYSIRRRRTPQTPASRPGESCPPPAAPHTGYRPRSCISHTVLIDDADLVRRTANRMLTKDGYRVLEAAGADERMG